MAKKTKYERKQVKEQKRIVKLLYRKGMLDFYFAPRTNYLADISWLESYIKRKKWKMEISFWVTDYWGEGSEYPLVKSVIDAWQCDHVPDGILEEGEYNWDMLALSTFQYKNTRDLIKKLKALPTKRSDHKINKCLRVVE